MMKKLLALALALTMALSLAACGNQFKEEKASVDALFPTIETLIADTAKAVEADADAQGTLNQLSAQFEDIKSTWEETKKGLGKEEIDTTLRALQDLQTQIEALEQ